jgi:hypothetical protein
MLKRHRVNAGVTILNQGKKIIHCAVGFPPGFGIWLESHCIPE